MKPSFLQRGMLPILLAAASLLTACTTFDSNGNRGTAQQIENRNRTLEQRVMAVLKAEPRIKIMTLGVQAIDGTVAISGTPETLESRDLALRIAARVPGVRAVYSNMTFN